MVYIYCNNPMITTEVDLQILYRGVHPVAVVV